MSASLASADVLYNIASFNNDGSSNTSTQWKTGITTITSVSGVTGTDDAGLVTLQTLQANPVTASRLSSPRFSNQDSSSLDDAVIVDASATGYAQFGIVTDNAGESINLSSLSFQAVRATTGTAVRGYDIDVSINGGAYTVLGAANVANQRNDGWESFDLTLTDTGVTSVDFRIYSTGGGVEYTNFAINGTVIPEPATLGMIAAFGGGILFIRRRFMI
jgi:hypothetical protein